MLSEQRDPDLSSLLSETRQQRLLGLYQWFHMSFVYHKVLGFFFFFKAPITTLDITHKQYIYVSMRDLLLESN